MVKTGFTIGFCPNSSASPRSCWHHVITAHLTPGDLAWTFLFLLVSFPSPPFWHLCITHFLFVRVLWIQTTHYKAVLTWWYSLGGMDKLSPEGYLGYQQERGQLKQNWQPVEGHYHSSSLVTLKESKEDQELWVKWLISTSSQSHLRLFIFFSLSTFLRLWLRYAFSSMNLI